MTEYNYVQATETHSVYLFGKEIKRETVNICDPGIVEAEKCKTFGGIFIICNFAMPLLIPFFFVFLSFKNKKKYLSIGDGSNARLIKIGTVSSIVGSVLQVLVIIGLIVFFAILASQYPEVIDEALREFGLR